MRGAGLLTVGEEGVGFPGEDFHSHAGDNDEVGVNAVFRVLGEVFLDLPGENHGFDGLALREAVAVVDGGLLPLLRDVAEFPLGRPTSRLQARPVVLIRLAGLLAIAALLLSHDLTPFEGKAGGEFPH